MIVYVLNSYVKALDIEGSKIYYDCPQKPYAILQLPQDLSLKVKVHGFSRDDEDDDDEHEDDDDSSNPQKSLRAVLWISF